MNKFPLQSNSALAAIALCFTLNSASGWVGGPWSEGDVSPTGSAGTYQAVMTGNNLVGVAIFGFGPTIIPNDDGLGVYAIFHQGTVQIGDVFPIVDIAGRNIAAVLESSSTATDPNSNLSVTLGGAFQARITSTGPNFRFSGDGEIHTADNTSQVTSIDEDTNDDSTSDRRTSEAEIHTTSFDVSGVRTSIVAGFSQSTGDGDGGGDGGGDDVTTQ